MSLNGCRVDWLSMVSVKGSGKRALIIMACVVTAALIPCDTWAGPHDLRAGLQLGVGRSHLAYDNKPFEAEESSSTQPLGGFLLRFSSEDWLPFAYEVGAIYRQLGGSLESVVTRHDESGVELWSVTTVRSYELSYLALPVMVRYAPTGLGGAFLKGGVEVAILFGASAKLPDFDWESSEEPEVGSREKDVKEVFTSVGLAGVLSIGYELPVKSTDVTLEVGYVYGLNDVYDPPSSGIRDVKMMNRTITMCLTLWI